MGISTRSFNNRDIQKVVRVGDQKLLGTSVISMDGLWAEESQTGSKALVGVQNGVMSLEKGKIVLLLWLNDFTQL